MTKNSLAVLCLRLGLIFVFAYVPVASYLDPSAYYHYLPSWSSEIINRSQALNILSIYEIILVLWFIWGRYLVVPCILAVLVLTAIVGFNFPSFGVIFRNVSIIFSAIALALIS